MPILRRLSFALGLTVLLGAAVVFRASSPVAAISQGSPRAAAPVSEGRRRILGVARDLASQKVTVTPEQEERRIEAARMANDRQTYRDLAAKTDRSEIEDSLMRSIEEQSRYPSNNQRFMIERYDPVLTQRAVEQRFAKSADGQTMMIVTTDKKQYEPRADVEIRASLVALDEANPRGVRPVVTTLTATLTPEGAAPLATFTLPETAPGEYQARLNTANVQGRALTQGTYFVHITAADGPTQSVAFVVRPAYGRFTGQYRDRIDDGALVVEVEVEAFEAGEFHISGSLYTDDGFPVGATEHNHSLTRGTHWVALRYHGKLVHDSGRPGPYRLAHVRLERLEYPVLEGVEADPGFRTLAYTLNDFDAEPYNPLDLPAGDDPEGEAP